MIIQLLTGPADPKGLPGINRTNGASGPSGPQGIQGIPAPAGITQLNFTNAYEVSSEVIEFLQIHMRAIFLHVILEIQS